MLDKKQIEKYRQVVGKIYDYKSEMKERGMSMDDLEELREMSLSSDLIPKGFIDFGFFLFLVRCDRDFDKTVTLLHEYFKFANDWPELFSNRNFNSVEVKAALKNQFYLVLPPTLNNCNVIFHHMSNYDSSVYIYEDVFKTFLMTIETCLFNYGPREGFVMIIDMDGGRIGHLLTLKLNFVRRGMRFLQEACPVKIREIHILNTVSFLDMILTVVRPFIKSDILDRCFFHSGNMDWEKFYCDHVPKSSLPSNYGGDLESVDVLHQKQCKKLEHVQGFFDVEEKLMRYELENADLDCRNECNTRM